MSSSDQQTARLMRMRKERYTLTTSSWAKLSVTKGAKRTGNQQDGSRRRGKCKYFTEI